MLVAGESISPEARHALRENPSKDAAEILMRQYDLSFVEAGDLLDVSMCDCKQNDAKRLGWSDKGT
jgi:DNA-directed RNA polymerase specialized sigma24 family protein